MQLPRGTFRSIRKGVCIGEVLDELASSRFNGISTLSSPSVNGTLVFKSGICVLAKAQNLYGDPAWESILQRPDLQTDIALSDLDGAQLQLALDFNKKANVNSGKSQAHKKAAQGSRPVKPAEEPPKQATPVSVKLKEREFIKTTPATSPIASPRPDKPDARKIPVIPPAQGSAPEEKPGDDDPTPAEKDLDTVDSMDLDDVAQKIRKDCKIILKQLQLDHLTEK